MQFLFPVPGLGKANTISGAILRGAGHGAMAGAEMPVESQGGSGDEYLAQKATQIGLGGVIGGGMPAVVGGVPQIPRLVQGIRTQQMPETVVKNVAATLGNTMVATPFDRLEEVQRAAAAGDGQAQEVIKSIDKANTTQTPGNIKQASINLQNYLTARHADRFYDKVTQLVNQHNLGTAPLFGTGQALNAAEREAKVGIPDPGLNQMLKDVSASFGPSMQGNYGTARKVISQLGDAIRDGRTGTNALISPPGIGQLQLLKNAVEDDMRTFVAKSGHPDIQEAQDWADEYYRRARVPFMEANVAKAGSTDESSQIWKRFIQADNPDRAQKLYNSLDPKGRAALQYEMVNDQYNQANDRIRGFDSEKFSRNMDKLDEAYGVTFSGSDKAAIDGMRNLVLEAARVDANPASAFKNLLPFGGVGVTSLPKSEQVLRYMMKSPSGRKWLYAAARLKPGTPLMQDTLRQVTSAAAKWAASQVGAQ